MDKIKEFSEVYENLKKDNESALANIYSKAKEEAKKSKKVGLSICGTIDLIIIAVFLFLKIKTGISIDISYIPFLITPVIFIFVFNLVLYLIITCFFRKSHGEYNDKFKATVIKELISNFIDDLKYEPYSGISESIYKEAHYKERYDRYSSEDYMAGKLAGIYDVQMAEIKTEREEKSTDSDGNTTTNYVTVFDGLFAKIKLNKSINTKLKIASNYSFGSRSKLDMDSGEFEKYFDVSCENKIVGMQILTADVMEEIVNFYKSQKSPFDVYILQDTMYIRLHCDDNFEVGRFKDGIIPEKPIKRDYDILRLMCELTNEIVTTIDDTQI